MTTHIAPTKTADRSVRRLRLIATLAVVTTATAAIAGAIFLLASPEAGSRTEATLAGTAAGAGLATAVLAITACIYASAAGLWERLPVRARHLSWVALGALIAHNLWTQIQAI